MIPLLLPTLFVLIASAQEVTQYSAAPPSASSSQNAIAPPAAAANTASPPVGIAIPTLTGSAAAEDSAIQAAEQSIYAPYSAPFTLTGTAAAAMESLVRSEVALYSAVDAAASASPSTPIVDACGPNIPDPSVQDSCNTPIDVSDTPATYGVQCLNDTQFSTPINMTSCSLLIPELCSNQWQAPNQWVWLTANGCSLGSFLPGADLIGHAPWPSQDQCEQLIYSSMVNSCDYDGQSWNIAAVNLRNLPDDSRDGSGEQVNVGYGSYVVAGRQLRMLSDVKDCQWIPPDTFCQGEGCYPASYYASKFQHPTPCAALQSSAVSFVPLGG